VKANKVQWEYSKRFLNESLLCLSPEGSKTPFTNCIFATVAESSPEDLKQGRVGVRFVDTDQQKQFDWDTQYVMIESTCFFGAVAPVLAALQAKTEIPFGQILLNGQLDNRPPAYIQQGLLNLSCLYGKPKTAPLLCKCTGSWPAVPEQFSKNEGDMVSRDPVPDPSQLRAIQHILSNKVAVVQGPPGTGKSFIGLKAVRIIVDKLREINGGPVLVVCYTNHALDQFLEDLLPHVPDLLRIGGQSRSKNERLMERNIHKIYMPYGKLLSRDINKLRKKMLKKRDQLKEYDYEYQSLLKEERFKPHLLLTEVFCTPPQAMWSLSVSRGVSCWLAGREKSVRVAQERFSERESG